MSSLISGEFIELLEWFPGEVTLLYTGSRLGVAQLIFAEDTWANKFS